MYVCGDIGNDMDDWQTGKKNKSDKIKFVKTSMTAIGSDDKFASVTSHCQLHYHYHCVMFSCVVCCVHDGVRLLGVMSGSRRYTQTRVKLNWSQLETEVSNMQSK